MSMQSIGTNPYGSLDFQNAFAPSFEQPSTGLGAYGSSLPLGGDAVTNTWPPYASAPPTQGGFGLEADPYGATPGAPVAQQGGMWNSIAGLIGGFGSMLQNTIGAIWNSLSSLGGSFGSTSANGDPSMASTSSPLERAGQQAFSNANFHSVGDPHDEFDGTSTAGSVNASWDDKHSHGDLISSDSFAGGFRVSTVTTPPIDAKGTRYNESATVTTNDGRTQITYNKDGSFYVSNNGQNVPLVAGQATSLGNGESVMLNNDGSLSVNESNSAGGGVSLTLSTSDGNKGVNVSGTANNVDLGGFLAGRAENASGLASAPAPTPITTPISQPPFGVIGQPIFAPTPSLGTTYAQNGTASAAPVELAALETSADPAADEAAPQTIALAPTPTLPSPTIASPVVASAAAPSPLAKFAWLDGGTA